MSGCWAVIAEFFWGRYVPETENTLEQSEKHTAVLGMFAEGINACDHARHGKHPCAVCGAVNGLSLVVWFGAVVESSSRNVKHP